MTAIVSMCLIDSCEEIQRLAIRTELDRIKPPPPCKLCLPGDPCWYHRTPEQNAAMAARLRAEREAGQ